MTTLERTNSKKLFESLCNLIPGGVHSTARAFKGVGVPPLSVERVEGDTLIDTDGQRYIDYVCCWGAIILGHNHPRVVQAVLDQMQKGMSFVNSNALELRHAELICQYMPQIEKVRMVSSGTESTMTAIRLGRAYSGKNLLVKFDGNYHGHFDALLVKAGSSMTHREASSKGTGVQTTVSLPYNDCAALEAFFERHGDEVGVVIIEPVA
ncbi:MAG TPA: aminotransferase class III-fold pyridoxal phosphate-dependent enzyme, partial [Chlamydiales bacterium]|nr:aminotransferase class III-fold pyridoxal phosphate-dependent enzyme [Chlamydiales bacterium]